MRLVWIPRKSPCRGPAPLMVRWKYIYNDLERRSHPWLEAAADAAQEALPSAAAAAATAASILPATAASAAAVAAPPAAAAAAAALPCYMHPTSVCQSIMQAVSNFKLVAAQLRRAYKHNARQEHESFEPSKLNSTAKVIQVSIRC